VLDVGRVAVGDHGWTVGVGWDRERAEEGALITRIDGLGLVRWIGVVDSFVEGVPSACRAALGQGANADRFARVDHLVDIIRVPVGVPVKNHRGRF
jgi:hypothetical protein